MKKKQEIEFDELAFRDYYKLVQLWEKTTTGASAPVVARAMSRVTRGIDWRGSALRDMKEMYISAKEHRLCPLTNEERKMFHKFLCEELTQEENRIVSKLNSLKKANNKASENFKGKTNE